MLMSNLTLQPYCYINLEVNGDKLLACRSDGIIDVYSLKGITSLGFFNNRLKSLPVLPNTIQTLICYNNQLETIPSLPENLERLFCANNRLQSLPKLPKSLTTLSCNNNRLQTLPELPHHLFLMSCDKNPLIFVHPCRILEHFFLPDHIKNLFSKRPSPYLSETLSNLFLPNYFSSSRNEHFSTYIIQPPFLVSSRPLN